MAIYLSGINMPSEGSNLVLQIFSNGEVYGGSSTRLGTANWVEAIPVLPHGRLIDADELLNDVRKHSESYFADDFAHEWVDVAPTVIEAEEGEA